MEEITIKDVARLSGVGVSTVSRAINNHPDIKEETRDKINQVIKEYNYIPNNSARNLKRSDSRTIAVLIKGITNPFFNNMLKVFEEEIQKKKYSFVLQRVHEREDEIDVAIRLIKEKRLKGIIFLGGYFQHTQEKLKQIEIPFVLSTIALLEGHEESSFTSVAIDDFQESYKMVDYLCALGHKKIAIIAAPEDDMSIGKLRLDGYKKALQSHGIEINEKLIRRRNEQADTYSMENGYSVTKELLESDEEFTALFAISDSIAIGACKAIFDAGKSIPEDYSVAGFDGLEMAHYYNPSITTIRQPVGEMAYETIQTLFDMIKKKEVKNSVLFPAELIVGESTRNI